MSCGCSTVSSCTTACTTTCPTCTAVCTALQAANSWNIPSCSKEAVLSFPGLATVLIGSYVYNPTYGMFLITGFNSITGAVTVFNECLDMNAAPGTTVPALTTFIFTAPPSTTNVTYSEYSVGTNYTLTGSSADVTFGTTSPVITLTLPGTYLLSGTLTFYSNGATIASASTFSGTFRRRNNTAADIGTSVSLAGTPVITTYTNVLTTVPIPPRIYTTLNSDDIVGLRANYTGGVPSAGSFQVSNASIVAVKLS